MSFRRQPSNQQERCPWLRIFEDEAAGQRVASWDSVHTARCNQSLRECQLLALKLWSQCGRISILPRTWRECTLMLHLWYGSPSAKDFLGRKWLLDRTNKKRCWLDLMLMPKGAKRKEASEAEKLSITSEAAKPKEALLQKQNLIFSKFDVQYKVTVQYNYSHQWLFKLAN